MAILWNILDLVTARQASNFQFIQGKTPLSTFVECISIITAYYISLLIGVKIMKYFNKGFKLNILFQIHNVLLAFISFILLALFIEQLFPILYHHGFFYAICSSNSWTQPLVYLYYLNYLCKYFELLDTIFLVVRKKDLAFLHYYHHGATALLCYTQLVGKTSVSFVPITLNLLVHVVMYMYYFLTARGIRVWWKEWVTRIQIIQFVIDLFVIYFASYTYFAYTYYPRLWNMGSCTGTESAALFGCALLTSYLFLFISFYAVTYKKKGKKVANRKVEDGSIAIDPKFDLKAEGLRRRQQIIGEVSEKK